MTTITIQDKPVNELKKQLSKIVSDLPPSYKLKIEISDLVFADEGDGLYPEWKEENIQPSFLKKMEESNEDVRCGRVTTISTEKDDDAFFNDIING